MTIKVKPINRIKNIATLLFGILFIQITFAQNLHLEINYLDKEDEELPEELTQYQRDHENFSSISAEADSIYKKIRKFGFIDAEKSPLEKKNDTLFSTKISLGNYYKNFYLYIKEKNHPIIEEYFQKQDTLKIPFGKTEDFLQTLNSKIANSGRPFSYLQLSEIEAKNENTLQAEIKISFSTKRTLDKITIKGYEKFPRAFLKNQLYIKEGRVFNKENLIKKVEQFKNLRFSNSVREPEILFTNDSTTLYLYLEKQTANNFDGFLGFSNEEDSRRIQLNGYANLNLVNNLNFGEELNLEYKNNGKDYTYFEANTLLPFLFNSPISIEAGLKITRQDSTFSSNEQQAGLLYNITPKLKIGPGYRFESSTFNNESTSVQQNIADFEANFFSLKGEYNDFRQSLLQPYKSKIFLKGETGKRTTEIETTNQYKIQFSGSYLAEINYRNFVYVANYSAKLFSKDYLFNELFRFGGIKNIRGFQENSITADFYTSIATEYRYLLDQNLYAHSILDFAKVENKSFNQSNNLYTVGFGLGYLTNTGLLKVIFANGKNDDQKFRFNNTKVHLSLLARF